MAPIPCPNCKGQVSRRARTCPTCGFSIEAERKVDQRDIDLAWFRSPLAWFLFTCSGGVAFYIGDWVISAPNGQIRTSSPGTRILAFVCGAGVGALALFIKGFTAWLARG
jgi:hypothetical protein